VRLGSPGSGKRPHGRIVDMGTWRSDGPAHRASGAEPCGMIPAEQMRVADPIQEIVAPSIHRSGVTSARWPPPVPPRGYGQARGRYGPASVPRYRRLRAGGRPAVRYSESRKIRLLPRRITLEITSRKPYFARNAAITFSWSDKSVILSARH
jgi:hypothetical protein